MVEELEYRADTLALFNEVSRSATAKLELSAVLNLVVEMAPQLLECDHSSIFLLDAESGRYTLRAAYGSAPVYDSTPTFAPGEGLVETRLPAERGQHPVPVRWTVDAGPADVALKQARGAIALRRARLARLLDEAASQGARPTLAQLCEALGVSRRTLQRDLATLRRE